MGTIATTTIALVYQEWTLNNNWRTKDNPAYYPYHTCSASDTVTQQHSYCSSAFVMWFLLCTISLRCMILSVVAVWRHLLSAMPTFSFISWLLYLCVFSMYSLLFHKNHSTSGLRTAVVLIAFKILSRRSGVGTCIWHQLTIHELRWSVATAPWWGVCHRMHLDMVAYFGSHPWS